MLWKVKGLDLSMANLICALVNLNKFRIINFISIRFLGDTCNSYSK